MTTSTSKMIHTGHKMHLTSREVRAEILERYGVQELTDNAAMSIASWYHSPDKFGMVFHRVQAGLPFHVDELHDAIADARQYAESGFDTRCLDMLATWALNHGEDVAP